MEKYENKLNSMVEAKEFEQVSTILEVIDIILG